jgi:hypothetical protein
MDHITLLLGALLTLSAAVGCSSGPPQDLLGPPPKVGQVYRDETKLTMVNGSITITDAGVSQKGQIDMTSEDIEEEEILAVAERLVIKSRIRVVSDRTTEAIRADGQTDTHTDTGSLEGETIEFEQVGDLWKKTLVGKEPNAQQQFELSAFPPPVPAADYYPAEPVKPGHRWNLDVKMFGKLMGTALEVDSGTWTRKFAKTLTVDGELFAEIAQDLLVRGKVRGKDDQRADFEFKLGGTFQRSLQRGFAPASQMTGAVTLAGTLAEGGKRFQVTITGPVTMEWKTQLK